MPLPFKLAKEKSVAQLAAELARLRKEEKDLEEELKKEPHHGRESVYVMVRSSISSLTGKHRRRHRTKREEEGGRRRRTTVKKRLTQRRVPRNLRRRLE